MRYSAIDGALRSHLILNPQINALVQTRVYPSYLASIQNPQYPLICFNRVTTARDWRYDKRITTQYSVWIYSNKGYDQTDVLFDAMMASLDNEFFDLPNSLGRVGFRLVENPTQDADTTDWIYFSNFNMVAIAFFK